MRGSPLAVDTHRRLGIAVLVALSIGCCAYMAFSAPLGRDYAGLTCPTCDRPGPAIAALASGDLGGFFSAQPLMGSASLVLRAPVVAVARSAGAGEVAQYRLGAFVCLLAAAALAWLLVAWMRPRGRQWLLAVVMLGMLLLGPLTEKALAWGHPEQLLVALLCVVAVIAAGRRRVLIAGVALGLALATSPWALLAILPAVIACPSARGRLLAVAGGVAVAFVLPMLVGDPGRFWSQNERIVIALSGAHDASVTPANVWFPYAKQIGLTLGPGGGPTYGISHTLQLIAHPLMLLFGLGLPLLYWPRARERPAVDLLLVLALVFLLRSLLDPLSFSYALLPFFAAIAAFEMFRGSGIPVLTVYSAAAIWVLDTLSSQTTLNRVFLAWSIPVAAYIAARAFADDVPRLFVRRRSGAGAAAEA